MTVIGSCGAATLPWLQGQIGGGRSGGMIVVFAAALLILTVAITLERQGSVELDPDVADGRRERARGREGVAAAEVSMAGRLEAAQQLSLAAADVEQRGVRADVARSELAQHDPVQVRRRGSRGHVDGF